MSDLILPPGLSVTGALKALWLEDARKVENLQDSLKRYKQDPLGFVKWAYPWGRPGSLERFEGPDKWQEDFLIELGETVRKNNFDGRTPVAPIRMAVAAGHGIGKGVMAGWLVDWIKSTRPMSIGTVTANTWPQLETKTWATIRFWNRISRTAGDFLISATGITHRTEKKNWACTPQTCREENSEAFAGQHAATSTSYYIFDESSTISEVIWQVAEGGLTDGEPMFFTFANPTRSNGKFFRIVFGSEQARWKSTVVDSRTCAMPNKTQIEEWRQDYGEDSDFFRVRVRGLPPSASDLQFIDSQRVWDAQNRELAVLDDEPLVAGVDLARGGEDNAVIRFRRGGDAKSIAPRKIPGSVVRDSEKLVALLSDMATQTFGEKKLPVSVWFLDGTGIGGPITDRMKQLGHANFVEVQFGANCPDDKHYRNMRAWMWSKMRDWLGLRGCIDKLDHVLESDLTGVGLGRKDKMDRITLESKEDMNKRGLRSPDDGDALALTFARSVAAPDVKLKKRVPVWNRGYDTQNDWMQL